MEMEHKHCSHFVRPPSSARKMKTGLTKQLGNYRLLPHINLEVNISFIEEIKI